MYRNSEGYASPVEGEVMAKMMREYRQKQREKYQREQELRSRPKVYIVSPYAGDMSENKKKARRYCRFAAKQKKIPFASHLFFPQFLNDNDPTERGIGLQLGISFILHCKEVWVFGDTISNGMQAEIDAARRMSKKIRYFTEDMEEKKHEAN